MAYTFKKDGKTDDGPELQRFLTDGNKPATLAAGTYHIASGTAVGPGSLGVLPANHSYRLDPSGPGYFLTVT